MKCWKSTEKIIYNDKRFDKDSNYKGSIVADAVLSGLWVQQRIVRKKKKCYISDAAWERV